MGFEAVVELIGVVVVGRLCLSVLPPGWPGYHDLREGGATLGACVLLGSVGLAAVPIWTPWALLLALRLALLPGAMRPRHELPIPRGNPASRLLGVASIVALSWATWSAPEALRDSRALLAPAQVIAGGLVVHDLFARLRRPAFGRAAILALYAGCALSLLDHFPPRLLAPWFLGGAWILAGSWIGRRTADKRARALALLGALGVWLLAPWGPLG